jgi:DNA replication and repair protein RecF
MLRYERAMQELARLLKFGPRDPGWLDGLEKEMAEAGFEIAETRAATVARLNASLLLRGEAGAFPCAELGLAGDTDRTVREHGPDAVEILRKAFADTRLRDAETRRTSVGPHATDLSARHMGKRMDARDCSTGEQKALLVSVVLAQAREIAHERQGRTPILLLDEIAAHLDSQRRASLSEEILALGAQAWLTGTDLALFDGLSGHADVFFVEAGKILRQN